ncbi:hypothetical protein EDD21DRAFT_421478 [Dissophora ornata]|nr:hypothetical protein EDD21DRAFT_421478 [Dissophora ornata]
MTNTPKQHPLLLPEILRLIMPLLARRDILSGVLVCSTWNRTFNALLWKTVSLAQRWQIEKDPSLSPSAELLHRNALHIRQLSCRDLYIANQLIPGCCWLEKLDAGCVGPQIVTLLKQSSKSLKWVSLKRDSFNDGVVSADEMVEPLASCEKLETLMLQDFTIQQHETPTSAAASAFSSSNNSTSHGDGGGNGGSENTTPTVVQNVIQRFYQAIKNLHHLELHNQSVMEPPTPILTIPMEQSFTPLTFDNFITHSSLSLPSPYASPHFVPSLPNLRTLRLFRSRMNLLDQVRLLHHCPNLITLTWHVRGTTHLIEDLSLDLHVMFLNLRALDMSWSSLLDADIASVLRRTPQLSKLNLQRTNVGLLSLAVITGQAGLEGAAQGFVGDDNNLEGGEGQASLLGMREHLLELDIRNCSQIPSQQILNILKTFKRLKDFKSSLIEARDIVDSAHEDWACLDLERLHINIIEVPMLRTSLSSGEEEQRQILKQLGRLTKLETLVLFEGVLSSGVRVTTQSLDLSLASGLDELRTLGKLRVFNVGKLMHSMGQAEYEWIAKHWGGPNGSLREMTGHLCPKAVFVSDIALMTKIFETQMPHVVLHEVRI